MQGSYGLTGGWTQGDYNYDGLVDFGDVLTMLGYYGQTGP